jgi:hypothetical protein
MPVVADLYSSKHLKPADLSGQRDVLIVKADRQEPLVVVRLSLAAEIAKPVA